MKQLILQILTWWNGQTVGTWLYTALHGVPVGEDESGNTYYRSRKGDRRWVIYNGESEASRCATRLAWVAPPYLSGAADRGAAGRQTVGAAA